MKRYNHPFIYRLYLAIQGLFIALRRERHMKIHIALGILLIPPLFLIQTTATNIWILTILIGLLIIVELINTAIETTVDLVTRRFSYRAKLAKDMASSAVLIAAGLVVIFSIFIYWPSMYNLIMGVFVGN